MLHFFKYALVELSPGNENEFGRPEPSPMESCSCAVDPEFDMLITAARCFCVSLNRRPGLERVLCENSSNVIIHQ